MPSSQSAHPKIKNPRPGDGAHISKAMQKSWSQLIREAGAKEKAERKANWNDLFKIEMLLRDANICAELFAKIEAEYLHYSERDAEKCIEFLYQNQLGHSVRAGTARKITELGYSLRLAVEMPNT